MAAPLTKSQKRYLSQLSDRAFARLNVERSELSASAQRAAFRHDEVAKACSKLGLRCCSQDDYGAVKARFLHLLGEDGCALKAHVHAASNGRRQVEWKITQSLARLGKGMAYAEGVCRQMYRGTALMDASDKQLWKLFYALEYQIKRQRTAGSETGAPHQHAA